VGNFGGEFFQILAGLYLSRFWAVKKKRRRIAICWCINYHEGQWRPGRALTSLLRVASICIQTPSCGHLNTRHVNGCSPAGMCQHENSERTWRMRGVYISLTSHQSQVSPGLNMHRQTQYTHSQNSSKLLMWTLSHSMLTCERELTPILPDSIRIEDSHQWSFKASSCGS